MKKLLLAGTAVLLMATSASAQSTSPAAGFFGGGGMSAANLCYWYETMCDTRRFQAKISKNLARGQAIHDCRAYGLCGQQRRR
jgi:hypothetical protein